MVDKDFCLSSYMAFRYTYKDGIDFFDGMFHQNYQPRPISMMAAISTSQDIHHEISRLIDKIYEKYDRVGILLSGGMDSAIVASYLKKGAIAYTFASNTGVFDLDIKRAVYYCDKYGLEHRFIDITFTDYKQLSPVVMRSKCGPVHSIEPQIYKAAMQAKHDGVQVMLIGDGADYVFGGMDQLLSQDWSFEDFKRRYVSIDPATVLVNPVETIYEPFEKYRKEGDRIDFVGFMNDLCTNESYSSYLNAFTCAGMPYYDPYAHMYLKVPLDLHRIRNGEPKYLIRDLFSMRYPELSIPTKIPMPRPVDSIFKDWSGPVRREFRKDIDMTTLSGNQKWQLWCAEFFLNIYDV